MMVDEDAVQLFFEVNTFRNEQDWQGVSMILLGYIQTVYQTDHQDAQA